MPLPVNILDSAKSDFVSIRKKVINRFGQEAWSQIYLKFKNAFSEISEFPLIGSIPEEIEDIGIKNYRQVLVNHTRIIYQVTDTAIYIHMLVDTRQDFRTVLYGRIIHKAF